MIDWITYFITKIKTYLNSANICEGCGQEMFTFFDEIIHFDRCITETLGYNINEEKFEPESKVFFLTKGWKL